MNNISIVSLLLVIIVSCSPVKRLSKRPIGLINNISYTDVKFNNPNASSGFIATYKGKKYAISAKHVLMIAKTDKMNFVDFEGSLEQWKMHPKNDSTRYLMTEKLLNANRKDSLTWNYFNENWDTYNDWLVFSVAEDKTGYNPLKFRRTPLKRGDNVYVVGWSYKDTIGSQRVYEYKFDTTKGNFHNLIQIKGSKSLGGLSGAPVIDKRGKVVGLVSSGGEDEKTGEILMQATTMENVMKFLNGID